ncbi:type II secretion system minor pseudopilin [Imhoffiella purpurea]|uniref:General secretion pathway protein K n=1 Tax=Imhoffiella purpurea TaxID=1249627 RepID=W9VCD7_9GAMM|nr:type II secretion system protein GspK [Imhoffiella purpurea]EXJ17109.1 General secretion pathway protein K [Imhoffiella purpurea]
MTGVARQSGIALVLVMWVLTLLTVMALGMTATQRTETSLTDNAISTARFHALADAAIAYTALSFMSEPQDSETDGEQESPTVWLPNDVPRMWSFAGENLIIRVSNESSRINLNQAQPDELRTLLGLLGVGAEEGDAIAAAIADWRDEDDLVQLDGAEDDDYMAEGRSLGAKDAFFDSVEELHQVMGMTGEIYRRLAPLVTVYTSGGSVDEDFAAPEVLATLRDLSLEEAIEEVEKRDLPTVPGAEAPKTRNRGGPLYRVRIEENSAGRPGRTMEALFELTPGQKPPYYVHWRRYGLDRRQPNAAPSDQG